MRGSTKGERVGVTEGRKGSETVSSHTHCEETFVVR